MTTFTANTCRTQASYDDYVLRLGGCISKQATLSLHSIKIRKLTLELGETFLKVVNGMVVDEHHNGRLIILCDYEITYNITKWFLECEHYDFAELSTAEKYNNGDVQLILLSTRNLGVSLRGHRVICMDVVPYPVLLKVIGCNPRAHIKVLVNMKGHDKTMSPLYLESYVSSADRSVIWRWFKESSDQTEIEPKLDWEIEAKRATRDAEVRAQEEQGLISKKKLLDRFVFGGP